MARFIRGEVVILPFPYADVSGSKARPALVLSAWANRVDFDYLLCLISSRHKEYALNVRIEPQDFISGGLRLTSYIRPWYLFTAQESVIRKSAGILAPAKLEEVLTAARQRIAS